MPVRKSSTGGHQNQAHNHFNNVPDDKIYKFTKGEIVWAKMKFFSAWPAKVRQFPNFKVFCALSQSNLLIFKILIGHL